MCSELSRPSAGRFRHAIGGRARGDRVTELESQPSTSALRADESPQPADLESRRLCGRERFLEL